MWFLMVVNVVVFGLQGEIMDIGKLKRKRKILQVRSEMNWEGT